MFFEILCLYPLTVFLSRRAFDFSYAVMYTEKAIIDPKAASVTPG